MSSFKPRVEQLEDREVPATSILDNISFDYPDDIVRPSTVIQQEISASHDAVAAAASHLIDIQHPTTQVLTPSGPSHIGDHTQISFGTVQANVWTGWERYGMTIKNGVLLTVGDGHDHRGTDANPMGSDHLVTSFPSPLSGVTKISLAHVNPGALALQAYVRISGPNGQTTMAPPTDGQITWNGSPITEIAILNYSNNPLGVKSLTVNVSASALAIQAAQGQLSTAKADFFGDLQAWDSDWATHGVAVDALSVISTQSLQTWMAGLAEPQLETPPEESVSPGMSIADLVASSLDSQEDAEVILPAMHVNLNTNSAQIWFGIEYSTPYDTAFFDVGYVATTNGGRLAMKTVEHAGGTQNGYVTLSNNDYQEARVIPIRMYDHQGGTLLQTAYVYFSGTGMSMMTSQDDDWASTAKTTTESALERQAEPGLGVDIQGKTVFASYHTPYDTAVVQIVRSGVGLEADSISNAAIERISNPGGTTDGSAMLAVPSSTPVGPLKVQLLDKHYGNVLATINLNWNGTILSAAGATTTANISTVQQHALLTTAEGLRPDIAFIQRSVLYEASAYEVDYSQFDARLRAAFPAIFPADFEAEVTRLYNLNPTYQRGWYANQLITAQHMKRDEFETHWHNYGNAMAVMLQKAVEYWVSIKNGTPDQTAAATLQNAYNALNINGMAPLGVQKPSYQQIVNEGHRLFGDHYDYMLRVQNDNVAALIADARNNQMAEERQDIVAQRTREIERTLSSLAGSSSLMASVINAMKAQDSQLAYHWAQEIVPTTNYSAQIVQEQVGQFVAMRLEGAVVAYDNAHPGAGAVDAFGGAKSIPIDILNSQIWDPQSLSLKMNEGLSLYDPSNIVPNIGLAEVERLKVTAIGRIFLGIAQKSVTANDAQLQNLAHVIFASTGINEEKALVFLRADSDPNRRPLTLRTLFKADSTLASAFETQPNCGTLVTAISANIVNSNSVRIRFNYATPNFQYDRGNIYILNAQGIQISTIALSPTDFRNTLWIDIPFDRIAAVLKETYGNQVSIIDLQFKVALWEHSSDLHGLGGVNTTSSPLRIDLVHSFADLSTNENAQMHQIENAILGALSDEAHFVVRNPREWRWTLASEYHHDSAFSAVDLNWGSEGASDRGKAVYAPADGKVVGLENPQSGLTQLVIEHTMTGSNGQKITWYSKYLHMDNISLKIGDLITKDTQVGTVSDRGAPGQNHFHLEILSSLSSDKIHGETIDLRNLLTRNYQMSVKAMSVLGTPVMNADGVTQQRNTDGTLKFDYDPNGGEISVQWNANLKRWTSASLGLVYNRDEEAPNTPNDSGSSFFLALEGTDVSQMKRVIWMQATFIDENGQLTTRPTWIMDSNHSMRWNGSAFVSLLPSQ